MTEPGKPELERAVVRATGVLHALAENQRALLIAVEQAARDREESERRERRARVRAVVFGAGMLGASAVALFAVAAALRAKEEAPNSVVDAVRAAIAAGSRDRSEDRAAELEKLATAMRDGLSERRAYEEKLAEAKTKADEIAKRLEKDDTQGAELSKTRAQLNEALRQIEEYQKRVSDGEAGIKNVLKLIEDRRAEGLPKKPEPIPLPTSAPASVPVSAETIDQINALLAYSSKSDMRLLEAGGRVGNELRDAVLTRYDSHRMPMGLLSVKVLRLEESPTEPRLRLALVDGAEIVGKNRIPFANRTIELQAVDLPEWKRRMPELFGGREPAAASAPAASRDARCGPLVERLNKLLDAHRDYAHVRILEAVGLDGETFLGVTLMTLVKPPGRAAPEPDQSLRAARMTLAYVAAERRLELLLEEGTRGRERPVPFPGGRLSLLIPGVEASEIEGGDPPLPIRRR